MARAAGTGRGFTLIEVSVALLLAALLIGLGLPAIQSVTASQLRASAGQVVGMTREAYARAALTGRPHRLVFDLEEETFRLEEASSHFALELEKSSQLTEAELKARADGTAAPGGARSRSLLRSESDLDEQERLKRQLSQGPQWSAVDDDLGKGYRLPSDCAFERVWVSHQAEAFTRGEAYLHFWPGGYTQNAIIRLTDDPENARRVISVKVNGLTGRAQVMDRALEIPSS
jgi:general secretion pathway protein H